MTVPCNSRASESTVSRGFTLVEILVVVVIIGVISSMVVLSFGIADDERELDKQARRLVSLLELTADEATLQGRDFGLEIMSGGYRFVELDPLLEQWNEVFGDDLLRPRQLDEGMEFDLFVEDRRVLLKVAAAVIETEDDEDDEDKDMRKRALTDQFEPHILILSSGDISPFNLKILRFSDRSEIAINLVVGGEIEIETDEPSAP